MGRFGRRRFRDGSFDEPYHGLLVELELGTLTRDELKKLDFVRWLIVHGRGYQDDSKVLYVPNYLPRQVAAPHADP